MSILVVGGAGYIGSHVCKILKKAGLIPVVFDNLSTGHSWAIQFGEWIQGSLEDEKALERAFDEIQPAAVIHLASLINVRDSLVDPALYWEKNLLGTLVLLKTMVKKRVLNLVFSSTAAVYGAPQTVPIDEEHPKFPLNPYGKTKWAIEEMLEDFSHSHGLRFAILRYFNASGADPEGLIGEAHNPETHLIPLVIQTALGLREVLTVYGNDYPTPDGTAIRDYVHVQDLADAHLRALKALLEGGESFRINLGTGKGYSVHEIIQAVEQLGKRAVPIQIAPRLSHDSPILVANADLARKKLGWQPNLSDLSTIISTAWAWELKRPPVLLNKLIQSKKVTV